MLKMNAQNSFCKHKKNQTTHQPFFIMVPLTLLSAGYFNTTRNPDRSIGLLIDSYYCVLSVGCLGCIKGEEQTDKK